MMVGHVVKLTRFDDGATIHLNPAAFAYAVSYGVGITEVAVAGAGSIFVKETLEQVVRTVTYSG